MRERANWLKSQSQIGKTKSFASQTAHHHFFSEHSGCHEPDGDPKRWFPDCTHLFVAARAKPRNCAKERKRNKTAHIAYKFLCSCGEARSDRFCIPSAYEHADFGKERVYPSTLCPNSDAAMIVAFACRAWSSEREIVSEALKTIREIKRSAMSGAQSALYLENR